MKINNKDLKIEDAVNFANIDNILLKRRKNYMLLSDYQVDVLKRNNIDFLKYTDIKQLLFDIEELLNSEYDEELDLVSSQLAELSYYRDTKKWEFNSHFYISFFIIWLYSLG